MVKPLRCGFVGFGPNGWGHITSLKYHPLLRGRTEIVKIFDPNPEIKSKIEKNKFEYTDNFEDLLNTPNLDAIMISSPPQFHANQVVAGLEAGLHVFSEVPMAIQKSDIERIIKAEDQSKKAYQFGENYIFYSEVLYASHLVESGKIGPTVHAEAEYLHDVTYRWRQNGMGDSKTPKRESWYSLFDPLAYAHSIGPAQVALGGLKSPMPFIEVSSYANDIGGENGQAISAPSKAFHVALFQTPTGATAKCANAYIIAREPMRMGIQVIGELGTYEAPQYGKASRLFLADDHIITKYKHRKGKTQRIGRWAINKVAGQGLHHAISAVVRVMDDWLSAIEKGKKPHLHARVAANMCMAGIIASESARTHKILPIPRFDE
jgi:predicted dehydrogenase